VPPLMEGSRRLRPSLFSGVHTCLEEGALGGGHTHSGHDLALADCRLDCFVWRGSTQELLCVQGFLLEGNKEQARKV
jgi:hypothetical protein